MPEGLETAVNQETGTENTEGGAEGTENLVDESETEQTEQKGVTLTQEEFEALKEGNMRQEDYSRNIQVLAQQRESLDRAYSLIQPMLEQIKNGKDVDTNPKTNKELQSLPPEVVRKLQSFDDFVQQAKLKEQKEKEDEIITSTDNEIKQFETDYPEAVEDFVKIDRDIEAGRIPRHIGEQRQKETAYGKALIYCTEHPGINLEDAYIKLNKAAFRDQLKVARELNKDKNIKNFSDKPTVEGKRTRPKVDWDNLDDVLKDIPG